MSSIKICSNSYHNIILGYISFEQKEFSSDEVTIIIHKICYTRHEFWSFMCFTVYFNIFTINAIFIRFHKISLNENNMYSKKTVKTTHF